MNAESEFNVEVASAGVKKEPFEDLLLTDNVDSAPFTSDLLPTINDASEGLERKPNIEGGNEEHSQVASKLRFSSELTPAPSEMKHDDVKGASEDSKERLALEINIATPEEKVKLEDFSDVVYSSTLSVPSQKRKRLQLEVVVPTLELVKQQRATETDSDYVKALQKMKNPKIKKKSDKEFSLSTVWARTRGLASFLIPLDKETQEFTVSRDFMASTYGGSSQATCPKISKKKLAQHGKDNFTYLHLDYHQSAPQVAGTPGLFFNSTAGPDWEGLQRVFTRIGSNKWQYMGMYEIKSCTSLTKEEWKTQNEKVRNTWTREICRQGWAKDVRARVRGRIDLGREPTEAEVEEILVSKRFLETVPHEVMKAYNCGEERIGVWTLNCVGYDTAFQLELCKKFPLWAPPARKPKGSKKDPNKPAKAKNMTSSQPRGKKRKRSESLLSEFTEPESEESDDDPRTKEEDMEMDIMDIDISNDDSKPIYTNRGTRSRPICL